MIPIVDHVTDPEVRARAVRRYRERGIVLPTFAQMRDPAGIPEVVRDRLKQIGLWDLDPLNLFRITWKNEPVERGGLFGPVNALELPSALTGVRARIVALVGRWFPTGAHKVGRPTVASPPPSSAAASTPRISARCGRRRGTTVAAAPSIPT